MKNCAILLAAGHSARMQGTDKLTFELSGKMIVEYSIETLFKHKLIDHINQDPEGIPLDKFIVAFLVFISVWLSTIKETLFNKFYTEREILEILYNETDGPNWKNNTNWCSDKDIGEWYGIETFNKEDKNYDETKRIKI